MQNATGPLLSYLWLWQNIQLTRIFGSSYQLESLFGKASIQVGGQCKTGFWARKGILQVLVQFIMLDTAVLLVVAETCREMEQKSADELLLTVLLLAVAGFDKCC